MDHCTLSALILSGLYLLKDSVKKFVALPAAHCGWQLCVIMYLVYQRKETRPAVNHYNHNTWKCIYMGKKTSLMTLLFCGWKALKGLELQACGTMNTKQKSDDYKAVYILSFQW